MSRNSHRTGQNPSTQRRVLPSRGRQEDRFLLINYDWFVPVQWLRRLSALSTENELESVVFPDEEPFDSHWQFFLEHQTHPPRLRLGFALLGPRDRSIRADIKFLFCTTTDGQVIKEHLFTDHTFFLGKGESISSFINDKISPKILVDIEEDLYQEVMSQSKQGTHFPTDDCQIIVHVRFHNEFEIQPKGRIQEIHRRFTADWKLKKFHHIIEQINQARPPIGTDRRLVSERFQFKHSKLIEGMKMKKWRLLIKNPSSSTNVEQTPLDVTLKCADSVQDNYGKAEIICKNDHHVLRRFMPNFEDLADNYSFEFFSLDELGPNIYVYRHEYNEKNGRYFTVEYLLLSIQIVQLLQPTDLPRYVKRHAEPTVISLNNSGKVHTKGRNRLLKSPLKESRAMSVMKFEQKRIHSVMKNANMNLSVRSPEQRTRSEENLLNHSFDPFADESRTHRAFPLITPRPAPMIEPPANPSPSRLQTSMLPNIRENLVRTPRSIPNARQIRFAAPSRIRSLDRSNPTGSTTSSITSATSSNPISHELPDSFTFLNNLFRSGLHSDVTIRTHDREWNLHKSILSSRSIFFHQHFGSSDESEVDLSDDPEIPSSLILDRIFLFIYTNQYRSNSPENRTPSPTKEKKRLRSSTTTTNGLSTSFETLHSLFDGSIKFGINALTLLCLQEMCFPQHINIQSAAFLLTSIQHALTGPYEKFHSNEFLHQVKQFKQIILRFIQRNSRDVLLSPQWKQLEKEYPYLVHDVLEFVVFQRIDE